jgi:hypothetical protein
VESGLAKWGAAWLSGVRRDEVGCGVTKWSLVRRRKVGIGAALLDGHRCGVAKWLVRRATVGSLGFESKDE